MFFTRLVSDHSSTKPSPESQRNVRCAARHPSQCPGDKLDPRVKGRARSGSPLPGSSSDGEDEEEEEEGEEESVLTFPSQSQSTPLAMNDAAELEKEKNSSSCNALSGEEDRSCDHSEYDHVIVHIF